MGPVLGVPVAVAAVDTASLVIASIGVGAVAGGLAIALSERHRQVLANTMNRCLDAPHRCRIHPNRLRGASVGGDGGDAQFGGAGFGVVFSRGMAEFQLYSPSDLRASGPNELELGPSAGGFRVKIEANRCVFSFLVVKFEERNSTRYHGGLVLTGSFRLQDRVYPALLIERWNNSISMLLCPDRAAAMRTFQELAGSQLHDAGATAEFRSDNLRATVLAELVQADMRRAPQYTNISEQSLSNEDITNCILFPVRLGQALGGGAHFATSAARTMEGLH